VDNDPEMYWMIQHHLAM